jgi:SAM-dependent methyltransferase
MGILADFVQPDWYLEAFTSMTAELPWTDDTDGEVDRLIDLLDPPEGARILDLACGWGRQSLELARRGFSVVGVDVSECLIEIAGGNLELEERRLGRILDLEYREADLRDLHFAPEFDIVLNLNGGAIGYFENDAQNCRTFAAIGNALRKGGRTLLQIPNPAYLGNTLPSASG